MKKKYSIKQKMMAAVAAIICTAAVVMAGYRKGKTENPVVSGQKAELFKVGTTAETVETPLPDVPKEVGISDKREYRSIAGGFSFTVPDGCTLQCAGNICYIRTTDNSMELSLTVTDLMYTDGNDLYTSRSDYLNRISGFFGGSEKKLVTCGSAERKKKVVSGYPVVYEDTEGWFKNDGDADSEKTKAYLYYTVLNPDAPDDWAEQNRVITDTEDDTGSGMEKGIILAGFSQKAGEKDVHSLMDAILNTLKPYSPDAEDSSMAVELSEYRSPEKDGAVIACPLGWKVTENGDGMVIILPDGSDAGKYSGFAIEYFPDINNSTVEDYAQFSGAYEYSILLACFTQPVGNKAFDYRSVVTDTDMDAAIGEKECIRFEVADQIIPVSKSVRYSMVSDSYDVKNIRYTFRSNGVDCMLNFIIPNDSFLPLVEKLLEKTQLV